MMSFHKVLLLLCALLMLALPVTAEEGNLLVNGSFEQLDKDGLPVGWHTEAWILQDGYTVWSISEEAQDGHRSAVVNNLGMNDARFAQTVEVEPETMYRLSGWIKTGNMLDTGRGANLSIANLHVYSECMFDTEGEWLYVEMYGETGPDQDEVTVFARVGGYSGESEGMAQFDGLTLCRVDTLPEDAYAELWFQMAPPVVAAAETAENTAADAPPFWPWLLVISAVYAAVGVLALRQMQLDRRELQESRRAPLFLWAGLGLAAVLRLVIAFLVEGYQVDVNCFLSWGYTMAQVGPTQFYQTTSFCDYTPAYVYVMGVCGWLARVLGNAVDPVVLHKLLPMASDLVMAWLLYRMARQNRFTRQQAGMLGLLFAFCPAMILNSAAWCQIDSVLCLSLMLVAWLAMRRKWALVFPVYVLCALIKPQALMLGFLGLAAIVMDLVRHSQRKARRDESMLLGLGLAAAVAAVVVIPFSIYQESPLWLIDKYAKTLASYPYATVNTANIFYLFGANWQSVEIAAPAPALITFALVAIAWSIYTFLRQRKLPWGWLESALMACFAAAFLAGLFFDASWGYLGTVSMAMAFAMVLPMFVRSGKLDRLPLCGAVLFLLLYVLGVKMHERYLFPALILLSMAYAVSRNRRVLLLLVGASCTLLINEGIVLDNSIRLGSAMGHLNSDTNVLNHLVSALNTAMALFSLWTCHHVCVDGVPEHLTETVQPLLPIRRYDQPPRHVLNCTQDASLHWKPLDWILMLSVTVVYAVVCLTTLGSTKAPQKPWKSTSAMESVTIDLGAHYDDVRMLYFAQVSYNDFSVAVSDDGQNWSGEYWAEMSQGQCFRWKYLVPSWEGTDPKGNFKRYYNGAVTTDAVQKLSGRYVRITAQQIGLTLNEVIFRDGEGQIIPAVAVGQLNANPDSPNLSDPAALLDEQNMLDGEPGWWNSTYFDEIYHARTAYEHLNGTVPYETSHPPLGKVLMSWAVALFGMTPFGWRFAGAMAGVLMLPAMYLLAKQLTKRTSMAFAAMALMTLDCMHFTQTRIATIDSFPVLFIIVSFFFMLRFMQRDTVLEPVKKLLPDLALGGFFMGLSIASKWIGAYAGAGLAILFFWTLGRHLLLAREARRLLEAKADADREAQSNLRLRANGTLKRCAVLCLWCLLFFVAVPLIIYLLSYIPYFAYAHKESLGDYLKLVIRAQEGMLSYHSTPGLGMDHPFYSPWYEWPLIQRPMYYASPAYVPDGWSYAIFAFGNPAVWLVGLAGVAYSLWAWMRNHRYALHGSDAALHLHASTWNVSYAFVLIGLLAQFLPWVLVPRGTYIYHYFASIPFLILATVLGIDHIRRLNRTVGRIVMTIYLILTLVCFIAFFPYASGLLTPTGWLDFMKQFLRVYY